jgi:hypothetical protein
MTRVARSRDPAALRPQPARDGPDFWPTIDRHLIMALVQVVLPALPLGPIWECAAGGGHLVDPMRQAGREVIASDLFPPRARLDIIALDFLHDAPPEAALGSCVVTNAPANHLDSFIICLDAPRRAPLYLRESDLTQYRFAAAPAKQRGQP